jgi:type IV pilus assembly protein PilO
MALAVQIEKFSKLPFKHKLIGLAGVTVLFVAVFYFMFYSDIDIELRRLDGEIDRLQGQVAAYEEKKQKYMAFRAEVNKLLEEQKELVKVLPTQAEIPTFLQSLHAQAELTGLNILTFRPGRERRKKFYAQIPVKMSISGTYHQIKRFFYSVGQLKRIVNIGSLRLSSPKARPRGVVLRASFVASTFRFLEPKSRSGQKKRRRGRRGRRG